ncbi:MAG TPA: hypothetical protein VJH03_00770 [Blastocatellia bacterium]|nr:hypothetical protein [Blastocatellia bacterium]
MLSSIVISGLILFQTHSWQEAQQQVARRYPQFRQQVYTMRPPTLAFRAGVFHDDDIDQDVYGSCMLGRDPEVVIGIVNDPSTNLDTLVHEYKHAITFRLPLSEAGLSKATGWIDSSGLSLKLKRARATVAASSDPPREAAFTIRNGRNR